MDLVADFGGRGLVGVGQEALVLFPVDEVLL